MYQWVKLYSPRSDEKQQKAFTYSDIQKLQRTIEGLNDVIAIFNDAFGRLHIPLKEKLKVLKALHGKYPVKKMCRVLDVDHSTFYNYHFRRVVTSQNELRDEFLKKKIMDIFLESDRRFGADKICVKLREAGITVSVRKVRSLMQEMNVKSRQRKKKAFVAKPGKKPSFPNRLHRNFEQQAPNIFWVGDVTQIKIGYVSCYLCVIIDLFSRKVIAHRLSSKNDDRLTINTFKDAYENRNRPKGVTFHSDRGATYLSNAYCDLLQFYQVDRSCSKAANPYDNAVAEAFFSNFKREEINSKTFSDFAELKEAVDKYMDFYNDYRPHQTLRNKTPNQVEESYFLHEKIGQFD